MSHKRYNVRRLAFRSLTDSATTEERLKLLAAARDHSSDVRRTFARSHAILPLAGSD